MSLQVAFLWLLDTARTFCNLQFIWFYLVDNHANLDGLAEFTGSFVAEAFLATLIILIVQLSVDKNITSGLVRAEVPASVQTVTSFAADVFIAVALSVVLHDKRTAFAGTSSLITKLVMYVLNRGILTALIQLVEFTTYISLKSGPNKLVFIVFYFPGTKIYTNSVLAM
ncbi:hypothetical protein DAEQUDRAFT_770768 [Daedalea quercina L-15889]|uniref:DUF6534 domain-containing protein n=1 Tax=Daedalea quercina L-15889 TaxID=1314783 RepID=A0A165KKL7_9APHY|nr:hypothetical protein DAEQUDRAFT_770768 [Daedalea quercina L-15889]